MLTPGHKARCALNGPEIACQPPAKGLPTSLLPKSNPDADATFAVAGTDLAHGSQCDLRWPEVISGDSTPSALTNSLVFASSGEYF